METQNQVRHRLRGDLSRLHNVLDAAASQGIRSLGQVADRVCEAFDLRDGRGRYQRARSARLGQGHYRLIDQPADSEVSVEHILAPHRERTLQRMGSESTVLCVQDTTTLSFTRRGQTQGLGVIGSNQTGALARGLHLHTTLAVNPDGVPLGAAGRVRRAGAPATQCDRQGTAALELRPRVKLKSKVGRSLTFYSSFVAPNAPTTPLYAGGGLSPTPSSPMLAVMARKFPATPVGATVSSTVSPAP